MNAPGGAAYLGRGQSEGLTREKVRRAAEVVDREKTAGSATEKVRVQRYPEMAHYDAVLRADCRVGAPR